MTFPGAGAIVYRNEAGEPLGWDSGYYDEPEYDPDDYLAGDYDETDSDDYDPDYECAKCGATAGEFGEFYDPKEEAPIALLLCLNCKPEDWEVA